MALEHSLSSGRMCKCYLPSTAQCLAHGRCSINVQRTSLVLAVFFPTYIHYLSFLFLPTYAGLGANDMARGMCIYNPSSKALNTERGGKHS